MSDDQRKRTKAAQDTVEKFAMKVGVKGSVVDEFLRDRRAEAAREPVEDVAYGSVESRIRVEQLRRKLTAEPAYAFLDIEASGLPGRSLSEQTYPIEIAVGWPEKAEIRTWLIKPDPSWTGWAWHHEAFLLHNISRELLIREGQNRAEVAAEVLEAVRDRKVLSDAPVYDQYWWWALNGEQFPGIRIKRFNDLLAELTGRGAVASSMLSLAESHAHQMAPRTHRAGDDVRHMLAIVYELLRLAT